jgi:hypothetical protein
MNKFVPTAEHLGKKERIRRAWLLNLEAMEDQKLDEQDYLLQMVSQVHRGTFRATRIA